MEVYFLIRVLVGACAVQVEMVIRGCQDESGISVQEITKRLRGIPLTSVRYGPHPSMTSDGELSQEVPPPCAGTQLLTDWFPEPHAPAEAPGEASQCQPRPA